MSIIDQAKTELRVAKFGREDSRIMIEILEKFFDQWDSGGSVAVASQVLVRLLAGKPLTPITGADSEWFQPFDGMEVFQNKRCSSIFKERDINNEWICYDIDHSNPMPWTEHQVHRWAHCWITFPYWPDRAEVRPPVATIGDSE